MRWTPPPLMGNGNYGMVHPIVSIQSVTPCIGTFIPYSAGIQLTPYSAGIQLTPYSVGIQLGASISTSQLAKLKHCMSTPTYGVATTTEGSEDCSA